MTDPTTVAPTTPLLFRDLALGEPLLRALADVGYESPSPIQAATIPHLLAGRDVLGQAQTGTGKTAAFALPILSQIDLAQSKPQALVLAPTRELGIQVAEAFQRYASYMPGFHVLPVYGGQPYGPQLSALRRGVHVVVGTPGRIIDHLDKGSLDLSLLRNLVLDEADEMLRMGFIDDVEAILKKMPEQRQTALFSATMPHAIRRIAQTYLKDPVEVTIEARTRTAENIRQRSWEVSGLHKLDALTRILEAEPFDAMIVFARTKQATDELAEKLSARGFSAASINGDVAQAQRGRDATVNFARRPHLGQHAARHAQHAQQFVVPVERVDVEQHRPRGVGDVGHVGLAARQLPDEPAVDGAEGQLAGLGLRTRTGDVVENPGDLAA